MVAAAIAVAAAVGEARGLRIVPQVRRQVPESWRRVLPVPLAAGLYGVLLGLGFTTFILTFAVWALAAVSVALGDPALGAVLGLAFGAGRALPVIALAPVADGDRGNAAHAAMAERPAILRGLRAADAVALAALRRRDRRGAGAGGAAPRRDASSRGRRDRPGGRRRRCSPSSGRAASATCAARAPRSRCRAATPRSPPASSAGATGARIVLADPATLAPVATYDSPGGGAFAFSDQWVVWLVGTTAARRPAAQRHAPRRASSRRARGAEQLGRPALAGQALVFHRAGRAGSQIRLLDLGTGRERLLRSERRALLLNPSFDGSAAALRALDLHPPGAAARPARPPRDHARPPPLRHHARPAAATPGTSRATAATARATPAGRRPRLAPRPPAGVDRHAVDTALGPTSGVRDAAARLRRRAATTGAVLSVPR